MFDRAVNTPLLWLWQNSLEISFSKNQNDNCRQRKTFQIIQNSKKTQKRHHHKIFSLFRISLVSVHVKVTWNRGIVPYVRMGIMIFVTTIPPAANVSFIYLFLEIYAKLRSKLTIRIPKQFYQRRFSVFTVHFEHVLVLHITVYVWIIFIQDINVFYSDTLMVETLLLMTQKPIHR